MNKVAFIFIALMACRLDATQLVERVNEGADKKSIGEAWAMITSFMNSDKYKCELVIKDSFYSTYKSLKSIGDKEVMDKMLIASNKELKVTKDEKNQCIILAFEYHSYYFAFTDLSLDDLHYSLMWREIGPNMVIHTRHMLVFNKQMECVAHYSG
jgi:hypothetical protein